ncbi:MAG: ISAs1 family transposase [Bacteroidales bacterium]|jgi:predicted transposase YbfD/YdcC|nr:ISAs1 family transposase [Bacteroidales bacterium]
MENLRIIESFRDVETTEEHHGHTYSVWRALTIAILGSLCGLENVSKIHQWSTSEQVRKFLKENFAIYSVPSYVWLLELLKLIKPESLSERFTMWVSTILPESIKDLTISFDGKTFRSTGNMREYENPLHILSAHFAEIGLTVSQKTVDVKSNEIPAMRELLKLIDVKGCMVVADALHCQTETAKTVINEGGDYLLSVKDNQKTLKQDIESCIQDAELRKSMDTTTKVENNGGRIEKRTAFSTTDIEWLETRKLWMNMASIGAIRNIFTDSDGKTTEEWHYYISSRPLSADELLKYARNEWSIESMHWLLDVHFREDYSRVRDTNANQNLNIIRKAALNSIRNFKNITKSKRAFSKIMFECLLNCNALLPILNVN